MRQIAFTICGLLLGTALPALGDDSTVASETLLSKNPWVSPRAAAMGGGLSPLADGVDAPYYNPAGIGGISSKPDKRIIRALDFPFIGAALNENSIKLQKELGPQGFSSADPSIKEAVLNAHAGERQYGRYGFVPKLGIGRMLFTYNYDVQMAATNLGAPDNMIDTYHRITTGPGFGSSFANKTQTLYLGFFSSMNTRKETKGQFAFEDVNDAKKRSSLLSSNATTYQGLSHNAGLIWRVGKKANPTLAVAIRDIGDTQYKAKKGEGEDYAEKQDLTVGFSVSPMLGKWGYLHSMVEASQLSNDDMSLYKKFHAGLELTLGERNGSDARVALRAGVNSAGMSYGVGLNMGLINLQAATYAEDIGIKNERVIERRTVGTVRINVAEF